MVSRSASMHRLSDRLHDIYRPRERSVKGQGDRDLLELLGARLVSSIQQGCVQYCVPSRSVNENLLSASWDSIKTPVCPALFMMKGRGEAKSSAIGQKRQPLVFLDVGGTSFKIDKSTLARYPECLLSKMVNEFPNLVEQREELYIDRDPLAFSWIFQIHRGGDYKSCVPEMSAECLQEELDFYQLPSLKELGANVLLYPFVFRENAAENLVYRILYEIEDSGLKDMYPWEFIVYHRIVDGEVSGGANICVVVKINKYRSVCANRKRHNHFYTALISPGYNCRWNFSQDRMVVTEKDTNVSYSVLLATPLLIKFLNIESEKCGLTVSGSEFTTSYRNKSLDIFKLHHKPK